MTSYGFPTLLQYSRLSTAITDIKQRSEQTRMELVTGRIADLNSELAGSIGDAQMLRKAIDDIATTQTSISRALGRAQTTQISLARASEGSTDLGVNLLDAVNRRDENAVGISGTQAQLQLDAAISAFNQRYEGRALFSGDAVQTNPLADSETLLTDVRAIFAGAADAAQLEADLDAYFNTPGGGFDTNIYLGGSGDAARTEISDGELVSYSAKADEQPIRDLLRNLSTIVVAEENTGFVDRNTALSTAATGLIEAGNSVAEIRSRIGAAEERMVAAQTRLEAEHAALGETYNERTARDPYEAATLLQQLETQLQTSYLLTSRISQLSLSNYI
ncbi:flagellin [Hyphococcus flavus]|uniref:Flagellin n=1 Tax=Hyphococcus flavus TaxID=1866326 RepID=A0AAF0CFW6_9PROT|nr:flagellin [Hyphococcus flavus]WDI31528.1 flagellin [Hyphococcus flavus]